MHKQNKKVEKYNYLGRRKPFIAVTISLIHTVVFWKCNIGTICIVSKVWSKFSKTDIISTP